MNTDKLTEELKAAEDKAEQAGYEAAVLRERVKERRRPTVGRNNYSVGAIEATSMVVIAGAILWLVAWIMYQNYGFRDAATVLLLPIVALGMVGIIGVLASGAGAMRDGDRAIAESINRLADVLAPEMELSHRVKPKPSEALQSVGFRFPEADRADVAARRRTETIA